ncbi:2-hydroxychromene-2-carboxylate isomerase [Roseibium hamelinense]|uniref:2-hydroxychromene-2-carboxylate isomerase n=1 Tax=Roseibium hamelinense TaxID=150831 RepID=A0A562STX5_9HYPH|nr:2-hydroxychromene-2-carboxylate isomerase [Roseibium hamelinense]MTI43025.1 2-hydroxychromene-2-carboxylate isomerase [Roseibium hamelinense]TWI84672.1 2-hydroxychromene-2-carboxylate isomerase [Roseibium hamelinense]
MSVVIDYFYTHISPWAYLGHNAFIELAQKHDVTVRARPVDLSGVFASSGGLPLGKRHPARQAYRFVEMQRWRDKRNVPLTMKPAFFPTPPALPDCCAIALAEAGKDALAFSASVFKAIWADDKNIAEEPVLAECLADLGHEPAAILKAAQSDEIKGIYTANQEQAVHQGLIGSPTYVLNGEPFWGQDRLEILEDALISKRGPYHPL